MFLKEEKERDKTEAWDGGEAEAKLMFPFFQIQHAQMWYTAEYKNIMMYSISIISTAILECLLI